jgi:DNA-binding Lrp family transcriptional regulator
LKLESLDYCILSELIKNPRLRDRQLAQVLGVSQPTVMRRRTQMERNGLLDYTAVPDLAKLDFEIAAFTFGKRKFDEHSDNRVGAARGLIGKHPNVIFVSTGLGHFGDAVTISIHKDYAEYSRFMRDAHQEWAEFMDDPETFLISLKMDNAFRTLTFTRLIDALREKE